MNPFGSRAASDKTRLYEILEISKDASQDEIKKAYRRQALKYHPDKQTGADASSQAERFKEINRANTILSNPETRKIYDDFGEQGVQLHENGVFGEDAQLFQLMQFFQSPGLRALFCCLMLLGPLLILLVPIFVVIKVDEKVDWSWQNVFIPLWILNALPAIYFLIIQPRLQSDKLKATTSAIQFAALLTFQILLCIQLETHVFAWAEVFIPVYVFEALSIVKALVSASPKRFRKKQYGGPDQADMDDEAAQEAARSGPDGVLQSTYAAFIVRQLFVPLIWLAFVTLVVVRLEGTVFSWWLVALPLFVILAWKLAIHIADTSFRLQRINIAEKAQVKGFAIATTVFYALLLSLILIFVVLVTGKISGLTYPLGEAFIPVFIVFGAVACCGCICGPLFCCCAGRMPEDMDVERPEGQDTPEFVVRRQQYLENSPLQ
eukprot:TRINITY_DN6910_c0_g1_i2.p1 TRINITY_DN6910_c0_g1~~TRINITY_DN6910_c0_g1_i2.p1  ORF type:complete len:435 (+),score=24.45 TRINITY_DN6910_c0_g1_i2:190-1494(+)